MTEKDLDEFEKEFGFKILPTSFKKLYQKSQKRNTKSVLNTYTIWYINDSDVENYGSIEFWLCDCTFEATGNYGDPLMVNVKELEAINKQCEELGWI